MNAKKVKKTLSLADWKAKTVGWRVGTVTDDTDGLGTTEYVIYDGVAQKVYKASALGGIKTEWGTITVDTASSVKGRTSGTRRYHFRITCVSGQLSGNLATTAFLVGHGRKKRIMTDPTPGSWTAAEGGGTVPPPPKERMELELTAP